MRNQEEKLHKTRWHSVRSTKVKSASRFKVALIAMLMLVPVLTVAFSQWRASALPCPCTVFTTNPSPGNFAQGSGIEVGFKFRSNIDGYISGIRFYKTNLMAGTHSATLWNNTGTVRLAQATFTNETTSGWQEVNFTPVAVTANTIYTASVFMADGNYVATSGGFASDIINDPLTAPRNGQATDGNGINTQGVFNASGSSAYPTSSFGSGNYWIDVSFTGAANSNPPTVTTTTPTANATSVNLGETVSATFDITMYASSITTSTFTVKDDQDNPVTGTVSYNAATKKASFVPTAPLSPGETYTVTLEGGSGTVVKSLDNIPLASDYIWTFTTVATDPCPCSIKDKSAPAGSATFTDSAVEVGVKVVPIANGYITSLRFYKPVISPETTHTGNIWSSSGTLLASATFTNETEYGWQEAKLSSPLQVTKDQLYILSYGTTTAVYQSTANALSSTMTSNAFTVYASGDSRNAATGSSNQNGVFTGTVGNYPSSGSSNGSYYWIDAVFSVNSAATTPLGVTVTQPKSNTYGVHSNKPVTATFNRALNASTVTGSTVRLFNSSNGQVTGTASYSSTKHQISFTPSSSLSYGQTYTMKLDATIQDTAGASLSSEYTWSFTVGAQLSTDPAVSPGGPILVVTSASNNYSQYYREILRAEGMNYFESKDISQVNASLLGSYDAVVLGEMTLTQPQADMFSAWVTAGGNLVAMRPDAKLASLLGLTSAGTTRTNQYLTVDTASAPGQGIVGESIQYKGTADNYTNNGATIVARLYSDASTSTTNPAATTRSIGSNGGTAMAFTYDLAKSVIGLHQGNQAWAGDERDGVLGIRPNDLFYGAKSGDVQADWVDLSKFHIPQADEQQRLLANMLTDATKDKKPLPRFWYLPGSFKAAMVFSGDDHTLANSVGTERALNNWLNESASNCSVMDWECVRASNYIYTDSALTNTRAVQYESLGFEVGDHPSNGKSCNAYGTPAQLLTIYANDLTAFRAKYTGLPNQTTSRFHCYLWNDWDGMAKAAVAQNIRYSLEYVAYPLAWIGSRAPLMTGSGMNMRFTDAAGAMLNIRQGVTNFDNSTANSTAINALLDDAVDSSGYFGIFGTHYDMSGDNYERTLLAAAQARGIPLITSEQALEWLDGRDSSSISSFTGADGQFGFTINTAEGAANLKTMLPINDKSGTLSSLKLAGSDVSYQTQTIKGVQYAVFNGMPGVYAAVYSDYDPNPPAPNPGGSNNDDPGTDSGSSGSSSTSSTKAAKKTNALDGVDTSTADDQTTEQAAPDQTTSDSQSPTTPEEKQKEFIQSDKAEKGWNWLPWALAGAIVAVLGGFLWFFLLKRRKRREATWQ